jgi:hypothetical protein
LPRKKGITLSEEIEGEKAKEEIKLSSLITS